MMRAGAAKHSGHRPAYVLAPDGWTPEDPNPFAADGQYGPGWSSARIVHEDEPGALLANGTSPSGLYGFIAGSTLPDLEQRLADFLAYETAHGRAVIVSCPPGGDAQSFVQEALVATGELPDVRPDDPRWLVHSTRAEAWPAIRECGELRAAAQQGESRLGVGQVADFREPDDYAEYVMLGTVDSTASEAVVASRAAGRMVLDPDIPYAPGLRLYFDAHAIIRDGRATRDGLHPLKIRERLPLVPYLVCAAGVAQVDPQGTTAEWTPRLFAELTNAYFAGRHCAEAPGPEGCDG
jgi:hypothetical protein